MKVNRFADNYFQVVLLIMLLGLLAAAGWFTYEAEHIANRSYSTVVNAVDTPTATTIQSFNECVAAGNPVSQSYPQTCSTPSGQHFTESP